VPTPLANTLEIEQDSSFRKDIHLYGNQPDRVHLGGDPCYRLFGHGKLSGYDVPVTAGDHPLLDAGNLVASFLLDQLPRCLLVETESELPDDLLDLLPHPDVGGHGPFSIEEEDVVHVQAVFDFVLEIPVQAVIGSDLFAEELQAVRAPLDICRGHAAGTHRPDVHLHDHRGYPADQLFSDEDREDVIDVRGVHAGYDRVIGDEEVAVVDAHFLLVVFPDHPLDVIPHQLDVNLNTCRLCYVVPLRRVDAQAELGHLTDKRRTRHHAACFPARDQRRHDSGVEQLGPNGILFQQMRAGNAGIAPGLSKQPLVLLEHLLERLSPLADSFLVLHWILPAVSSARATTIHPS